VSGGFEKIIVIKSRCPLCHGDVAGNDKYKYYCRKCNILFDKKHIENRGNPFGNF
jgi:hypothetical protein